MRRLVVIAFGVALLGAGGFAAWRATRPAPPPEPAADLRTYDQIPRDQNEEWMRSLGYTE
jgi:hypothetical protein